jgi:hypothetical protein
MKSILKRQKPEWHNKTNYQEIGITMNQENETVNATDLKKERDPFYAAYAERQKLAWVLADNVMAQAYSSTDLTTGEESTFRCGYHACFEVMNENILDLEEKIKEAVRIIDNLEAAHDLAADERNGCEIIIQELRDELQKYKARTIKDLITKKSL